MLILMTNANGDVTDKYEIQPETVESLNALIVATTSLDADGNPVPRYASIADLIVSNLELGLFTSVQSAFPPAELVALQAKREAVNAEIDAAIEAYRAKGRAAV